MKNIFAIALLAASVSAAAAASVPTHMSSGPFCPAGQVSIHGKSKVFCVDLAALILKLGDAACIDLPPLPIRVNGTAPVATKPRPVNGTKVDDDDKDEKRNSTKPADCGGKDSSDGRPANLTLPLNCGRGNANKTEKPEKLEKPEDRNSTKPLNGTKYDDDDKDEDDKKHGNSTSRGKSPRPVTPLPLECRRNRTIDDNVTRPRPVPVNGTIIVPAREAVTIVGSGAALSSADLAEVLASLDVNGDGLLDEDEVQKAADAGSVVSHGATSDALPALRGNGATLMIAGVAAMVMAML